MPLARLQAGELRSHGIDRRAQRRFRIIAKREVVFVRSYRTVSIAERRGKSRFMPKARRQERLPTNEIGPPSHCLERACTIASHLERSSKREVGIVDVPISRIKLGDAGAQNTVESSGG